MGRTVLRQGDGIIGLVFLKGHPTKKKKKRSPHCCVKNRLSEGQQLGKERREGLRKILEAES